MNRRTLLGGAATLLVLSPLAAFAQNRDPIEASRRAAARRERGDPDPERATAEGLSRERAQKGHRARRHHRLFVDDRGDALRPHRDRLFRSVLLRARQIEGARDRAVRGRGRARLADLQLDRDRACRRSGDDARRYPRQGFRFRRSGLDLEPSDPARACCSRTASTAGKDYRPVHLGTHDAVARAVQNGQVPAGALSKAIFEVLLERKSIDGDKVRVIATSDPIPNYPMVMQGNLAPAAQGSDPQGVPRAEGRRGPQILPRRRASRRPTTRPMTCCARPRKSSISTCRKMRG